MTWTFPFISRTPTDPCISHTCYPPISPVPLHVPYFPKLRRLYISSTLRGSWSITHLGDYWSLSSVVAPDLSSGLSLEQVVGFSFVHSLLGFLGCESWVRLN